MKMEIERRFLVDEKKLPILTKGKLITQGYLTKLQKETDPLVRVRLEGKKAYVTIKLLVSNLSREEFEYPIPKVEAEKLLASCFASVQKIRHPVKIGSLLWTIDIYEGENYPLVTAEVELKSEKEKITPPLWVTKEVTPDKRFWAYSLAIKPFSSWKKSR